MHIHLLESDRFSSYALAKLKSIGSVSFSNDKVGLAKAEILFVRLGKKIDRQFIEENSPLIRFIISPTTGHDHLDTDYFHEKGIHLISLKGEVEFLGNIPSTAEHTWGLLLSLMRKIPQAIESVKSGVWNRDLFIGNNLQGKNLGILGFGRVGKQVSGFGLAFGMKIHTYDVKDVFLDNKIIFHSTFESFAKEIDILSIHIPMDKSTEGWLNEDRINLLPKGIKIINTSRGRVWDESFIAQKVREGYISGVASDVLAHELNQSVLFDSELVTCAKQGFPVIITPHIAGACFESMHMTEEFVVEKLLHYLNA